VRKRRAEIAPEEGKAEVLQWCGGGCAPRKGAGPQVWLTGVFRAVLTTFPVNYL